jgi:hypothetical protein
MAAGAAIASDNSSAATASAYNAGVAAGSADTTTANSAGASAGTTATTTTASTSVTATQTTYATGSIHTTLPAGSMAIKKDGTTYYLHGNTWFLPAHGANGVYYRVVPTP